MQKAPQEGGNYAYGTTGIFGYGGGATAAVGAAYRVDQQTICLERAPFDLVQLFLWSDEVAFAKHNVLV